MFQSCTVQLAVKTSSSKKRKISTRRSAKDDAQDGNSPDSPLQSCENDSDINFSFNSTSAFSTSSAAPGYLRADSLPPASSLPPHLLSTATGGAYNDSTASAASSPSGAYADLTIDSDRGGDTSPGQESTLGSAGGHTLQRGSSPFTGRPFHHRAVMGGAAEYSDRAASPLKRRASSMEPEANSVPPSDDVHMITAPTPSNDDHDQDSDTKEQGSEEVDGAIAGPDPATLSTERTGRETRTQATKLQPPTSVEAHIKSIWALCAELQESQLRDGDRCYLVSRKWVRSVIGDDTDGKTGKNFTHDAESIVPVDNSDIIWEVLDDPTVGANATPGAKKFVRLQPGTDSMEHFALFPPAAWKLLMQWPGLAPGQYPILRTAHASSENQHDSNVMFELHPPVLTIHRLWSANSPRPVSQILKIKNPPPVKLARSSTTPYKTFLAQAKHVTDIDLKDKVRVWSIPRKLAAGGSNVAIAGPTPPSSPEHDSEVINPQDTWTHLLLDVESFLKMEKGVDREEIELSDPTANPSYTGSRKLALFGITVDQTIVLDEQVSGSHFVSNFSPGKMNEKPGAARSSSASLAVSRNTRSGRSSPAPSSTGTMTRGRAQRSGRTNGTVGLGNMGNTCYMNAALQCVRSVEELTKYFLSGEWENEINRDNVLAFNGEMAMAYASLLLEIYKDPSPSSVTPRHFKNTLGRHAPSFSGWGQQDSQEFLGFLLDGLQEDLSRVKKKPYIEKPDSTDEMINNPAAIRELADAVWAISKKRDDSVIADLFTGLYQSTLVCPDPECAKVSITFDPFNNLTLPLPVENKWGHTVRFFPLNDKPINIRVELDKTSSIRVLKEFISARVGVPVERLHGAEQWKGKFYKQYANGAGAADEIGENDAAWFFELEDAPTNWNPAESRKAGPPTSRVRSMIDEAESPSPDTFDKMLVPVIHRKPTPRSTFNSRRNELACVPFFILLSPEEARSEDIIRRKILQKVATLSSHVDFDRTPVLDTSDTTEPEMVGVNGSDSGSSGSQEGKVMAQSVQGEDDIVDVTMKDAGGQKREPNGFGASNKSPSDFPPHKHAPTWIDPEDHLPAEFQNLFELSYFQESGPLVASGMNGIIEDKEYPKLSSRAPQDSSTSEEIPDNATNGTASNEESSSDELAQHGVEASQQTRMANESDEGASSPVFRMPHRPKQRQGPKPKGGRKPMKGYKQYGKKGNKRRDQQAASKKQLRHVQQQDVFEPLEEAEVDDALVDFGSLIRPREGIVVDWYGESYDKYFGGGHATWDNHHVLPDADLDKAQQARKFRRKNGITLDNCLDEFEREEVLSEQDTWYCPRCKRHQRATKKFDLWKTPDILVVHLKRFSSSGYRRDKLEVLVDFPLEGLDLTRRVKNKDEGKEEVYDLIGIDCHWGGLGGGHYTAHAKNFVDQQWYSYNDSSVSKASPDRIVDSGAYLLFYRRRSAKPLGGERLGRIIDSYDHHIEDEELPDAGEEGRLGEGSSHNGSPSAFQEHEVGLTHQRQTVTHGGSRSLGGSGGALAIPSVEDEGIDMNENHVSTQPLVQSWSFGTLQDKDDNRDGSDGQDSSTVASDEAQYDSPPGGPGLGSQGQHYDGDGDVDMIPGVSQFDSALPTMAESGLPAYEEPPEPTSLQGTIERDEMSMYWNQNVVKIPAPANDQQSEAADEIRLEDDDDRKE